MVYTCKHCRFTFKRVGKIEDCPDCGKQTIHEATQEEKEEYERNRAAFDEDSK